MLLLLHSTKEKGNTAVKTVVIVKSRICWIIPSFSLLYRPAQVRM